MNRRRIIAGITDRDLAMADAVVEEFLTDLLAEMTDEDGISHAEGKAFDAGIRAAHSYQPTSECPYPGHLREAWMIGHSVGVLDTKHNAIAA